MKTLLAAQARMFSIIAGMLNIPFRVYDFLTGILDKAHAESKSKYSLCEIVSSITSRIANAAMKAIVMVACLLLYSKISFR